VPSSPPPLEPLRKRAPIGLAALDEQVLARAIVPDYVASADLPWLGALLAEREKLIGQKRSAWIERLREGLPVKSPRRKLELALRVLDGLSRDHVSSTVPARRIRAALFPAAAVAPTRAVAIELTACQLGLSEAALLQGMFSDLPAERVLAPLKEPLTPEQLALRCNAELIASLLARALRVRIEAHGNVRAVVRHAKLLGLLCQVERRDSDGIQLELSGPFALFRHTRVYGRALASLVPRLSWCNTYRLSAECVLGSGQEVARLVISAGDPVLYAKRLAAYDSKLEERFARSFARLTSHWEVVREPTAFSIGESLVFPDFELRHRLTGASWLLEIVGYWTAEYIERKLSALREARIENLILCIDESRGCSDEEMPASAEVIRFRRSVDPRAVLAIIERGSDDASLREHPL
jgi:predicted nuclease of restriction endonuclease-like RecB superfamily